MRERIAFSVATAADDPDLRRLLRENPMLGRISVSLEREPDARIASAIEGDVHGTLIARNVDNGEAIAMGGYAVRNMYLNGRPQRVGYLGQLRVDTAYRGRRSVLLGGYGFLRQLHPTLGVPLYLTSIVADNRAARRVLTANLPGMPVYRELEPFVTLLIPVPGSISRQQRAAPVVRATADQLDEIVDCLARNGARHQFTPRWTRQSINDGSLTRGLQSEDFYVAVRGGKIVGCVARWDQREFKQAAIRGYDRATRILRPAINLAAPILKIPRLPGIGQPIQQAYLSHLAIDEDDPDIFAALLGAVLNDKASAPFNWLVLGLAERHPLLAVARCQLRCREYRSMLYVVHWEDGAEAAGQLDGRIPHPEVAVL
jgi:hypothetical protein